MATHMISRIAGSRSANGPSRMNRAWVLVRAGGMIDTKGAALVIPLLPPRARERGVVKLPHSPVDRLIMGAGPQGCAAPVLPFDGTVELFRRAGSAALDPSEWVRVMRPSTLPEPCRSRYRIALIVQMSSK